MTSLNTRFPYGRRVKLIFIYFAAALTALFVLNVNAFSEGFVEPPGSTNLIRTSNSADNYSVFETAKNTVSARGKYTGDRIRRLFIDKADDDVSGAYSIKVHDDGSYEAEITYAAEDGAHALYVQLNSGARMKYPVYYSAQKGWYFPVNGLAEQNRAVFGHIYEAPAEASAYYISPTANAEEMAAALEQIQMFTDSVTQGIESDYEKARAISRFISERICYDLDARDTNVDNATIALCNVLKSGRTVCAGFANLFCAMAECAGLDSVNIKGGVVGNDVTYDTLTGGRQNHEWSAFYFREEERWVWVDACWDGSGNYEDGEYKEGKPKYMYFDISDEAFSFNHRADKAERRHYLSAKAEIVPLGANETEQGEKQPVITSQQLDAEHPEETSITQQEDGSRQTTGTSQTTASTAEEIPDAVYIAVIAALAAAVIITGAVLIRVLVKGRNNKNGNY